jgi:hypothetical protein
MLDETGRSASLGVTQTLELLGTDDDDRCPATAGDVLFFATHGGFDNGAELGLGVLKAPRATIHRILHWSDRLVRL